MLVSRENLINTISKVFPFNLLSSEKINTLVEKSEVVFFKEGNLVFLEGASASNFYVIYEGLIEILVEEHQTLRRINSLHGGDYFGEDVFKQSNVRRSTARVMKDVLLIRISKKLMDDLISENPELAQAFHIITGTYTRLFDLRFRDLSHETVYFIGNPHFFVFLSKLAFSLLIMLFPVLIVFFLASNSLLSDSALIGLSVLGAVLFFLQAFWHYLEWRNDYYVLTGKRVINLARNLINFESKFEIPLSAINNLEIKKSFFGQNINFGDLIVRTYTGETILKSVPSVSEVQSFLVLLVAMDKASRKIDERKSFERIVDNTLTANKKNLDMDGKQEADSAGLAETGIDLTQTILHTHWIILLKKVFFPSLLLVSIILLLFFFIANNIPVIDSKPGIILVGFILIGTFLWWLYQFFDWWNDQYCITSDQIIDIYRKPFGTENRRTASVLNIQSIRFERKGLLGLLLNFGTVYIRVGDEEFTFDNVSDPARIQEKLFCVLEMAISRIKKSEITEQQQNLVEWMDTYHQVREKKPRNQ